MRRWWYSASASRQIAAGIAALLIAVPFCSSPAWARAMVFPTTSTPGAHEKYSLRIINERDVPTLRVEIHFPKGLQVISFGDVPGWKLQILTDSARQIAGAVWTGVLERQHFVEFPFIAVNPQGHRTARLANLSDLSGYGLTLRVIMISQ